MGETQDIVIAGVGLITPFGELESTWRQLLAGRFITDHGRAIDRADGDDPNVITLADIAAREAIAAARWESELQDDRTALVVGTSKGPADEWLVEVDRRELRGSAADFASNANPRQSRGALYRRSHPPTSDKPSCEDVTPVPKCEDVTSNEPVTSEAAVMTMPARPRIWGLHEIAEALSHRLELGRGPRLTTSAACASGLHALIRAAMLLKSGDADRVLVVASESSLHEAFIQSFKRLGVIAAPGEPCRPFDVDRSGFLISEAAAAICLERRRPRAGEIVLEGYAIGADASHLTGTDPRALALKRCLQTVTNARPVDLVHAHATGTIANDPIELSAIETVTDGSQIIYSHKGAIGHTLGASGMVATVLNVMAHRTGEIPGNVSTRQAIPTKAGQIGQQRVQRPIRRSIAIAAGFGGATGVVGLRTSP